MPKKQIEQKARYSGIELLRILTICGVILLHYNDGKALKWVEYGTANQYILFIVESMCICAVDLFMVISGYFLSQTQKRTAIKPLELLFEVALVNAGFEICGKVMTGGSFSILGLIKAAIPTNYFVTLYIVVYILSPWINLLLTELDSQGLRRLLITALVLFSILPTLADLTEELVGKEIMGLNTVGAWGAQQGFTAVNFILCYMVGAYLHLNKEQMKKYKKRYLLFAYLFATSLIFVWSLVNEHTVTFGLRSAWEYCNPMIIFQAVSLFLFFKSFTFQNVFINRMAKSVFTCYLVHGRLLRLLEIEKYVCMLPHVMLLHMILSAVSLYGICWGLWWIYDCCSRRIVKKLGTWLEKSGIDFSVWQQMEKG